MMCAVCVTEADRPELQWPQTGHEGSVWVASAASAHGAQSMSAVAVPGGPGGEDTAPVPHKSREGIRPLCWSRRLPRTRMRRHRGSLPCGPTPRHLPSAAPPRSARGPHPAEPSLCFLPFCHQHLHLVFFHPVFSYRTQASCHRPHTSRPRTYTASRRSMARTSTFVSCPRRPCCAPHSDCRHLAVPTLPALHAVLRTPATTPFLSSLSARKGPASGTPRARSTSTFFRPTAL